MFKIENVSCVTTVPLLPQTNMFPLESPVNKSPEENRKKKFLLYFLETLAEHTLHGNYY